jgi:hypothetical protein
MTELMIPSVGVRAPSQELTSNVSWQPRGFFQWLIPRPPLYESQGVATLMAFSFDLEGLFSDPQNPPVVVQGPEVRLEAGDEKVHLLLNVNERFRFSDDHVKREFRGEASENTGRWVFEYLTRESGCGVRAGLTIHVEPSSWSSWPPHDFEQRDLSSPLPLFPYFYEEFVYVTLPPNGWGLQVQAGHAGGREVSAFRDREIRGIRMGSHPVVAAPGVRLAYFWAYAGGEEKF